MYNFKYYNGVLVEIVRTWVIGNTWYHDVVEVASRKRHRVELHELQDACDAEVAHNMSEEDSVDDNIKFTRVKDDKVFTFVEDSSDYQDFVKKNKLSEVAIINCLKGVQKTHKGFIIQRGEGNA
ncbi:hypothetical protein AB9M75_04310 [Lactobacillus sp. AN1001]